MVALLCESIVNETSKQFLLILFYSFFIAVREQKKSKAFSVEEKLDIPAQMHVNRLTHVALAATFRIVHWQWALLLKEQRLESVINYVADSLVKRGVSVTSSRIARLVSHMARSTVISGILLREKALQFTTRLDIEDLKASNRWIGGFKQQQCSSQNCTGRVQQCRLLNCWGMAKGRVTQN